MWRPRGRVECRRAAPRADPRSSTWSPGRVSGQQFVFTHTRMIEIIIIPKEQPPTHQRGAHQEVARGVEDNVGHRGRVSLVVLQQLVGAHIPQFNRVIGACRRRGAEEKGVLRSCQRKQALVLGASTCRCDAGAIGVEGHRVDQARVVIVAPDNLLAGQVPNLACDAKIFSPTEGQCSCLRTCLMMMLNKNPTSLNPQPSP